MTRPTPDETLILKGQRVTVIRVDDMGVDVFNVLALTADGDYVPMEVTAADVAVGRRAVQERSVDPKRALASLYGYWMRSASEEMRSGAIATKPIRRFAHQDEAVDRMLSQPRLRFLLGDEPGTGKTMMTGLYVIEARRKHLIQGKVLVVAPAHLVKKWERELLAYFGIEAGIVTPDVGRDLRPLRDDVDTWLVSVDLFTYNTDVRSKLAGPDTSWSLVVFDEAHRLTPTSQYLGAGQQISDRTTHLLLLTATPHRGKELFFRELMALLDPSMYSTDTDRPCIPSTGNFLRRMKEDLKDDKGEPLFPQRFSETVEAAQRVDEQSLYQSVMEFVDGHYQHALTIARIIYGKRTASSTAALRATLKRRLAALTGPTADLGRTSPDKRMVDALGGHDTSAGVLAADDDRWDDLEDVIVNTSSANKNAEKAVIDALLAEIDNVESAGRPSKWDVLLAKAAEHDIRPGNDQLLVFTESTDTAKWLTSQFTAAGFTTEILHGDIDHGDRDRLQQRFMAEDFQVLVSTDAGGEGIDLQSANVMFNWDLPWSMVRLEQRMGRLHRIGQERPVFVYHLLSPDTAEGRVQQVMLNNIAAADIALSGRVYDLMDATAARLGFDLSSLLTKAINGEADAADVPGVDAWQHAASALADAEKRLTHQANMAAAQRRLDEDELEQINPVHVRRFLSAVADCHGWRLDRGPHTGIHVLDAEPDNLPDYLGGKPKRLVAVDREPLIEAINSGAVNLRNDVAVFGPTEEPFARLAEQTIEDGVLDFSSQQPIRLIDTETFTPYVLGLYEMTVSTVGDVGRKSRKVPFLVRLSGTGETITPEWPSVLRLAADGQAYSEPPPLSPGSRSALDAAAADKRSRIIADRVALRRTWITETTEAMDEQWDRYQQEIADRPDDERAVLLARRKREVTERRRHLENMAKVDAAAPTRIATISVAAGQRIDDPATHQSSERVAVALVMDELERLGFTQIDDLQLEGGVGYDLKALGHPTQQVRAVEVKGLLGDLEGITLEQSEWSQAQQLGDRYWLYVVTNCATDPKVAIRMQNPASKVDDPRSYQRFPIKVSELRPYLEDSP